MSLLKQKIMIILLILNLPNESNEITGLLEAWIEKIKDAGFFTSNSSTSPFSQPEKSKVMNLHKILNILFGLFRAFNREGCE